MNNQSQLALACINYDSAKQALPPMRGKIGEKTTTSGTTTATEVNVVSWIGFILPYMELNQLYQNLSNVTITSSAANQYETQLIRIKSLLCPSADLPDNTNPGTHYVCNGGYQNAIGTDWTSTITRKWTSGSINGRIEPGKASDAVFLDQWAYSGPSQICTTKVSIDYISSHSGTSNVILLSENDRPITGGFANTGTGARWAYWLNSTTSTTTTVLVGADDEERIAFCYPYNTAITETSSATPSTSIEGNSTLTEFGADANRSHKGYEITGSDTVEVPGFINAERGTEFDSYQPYRRARPSSRHPGIVMTAFADRSVRPLNESINKQTFVWICQPNSGHVVSGDAF
jgi:hypothetical protein